MHRISLLLCAALFIFATGVAQVSAEEVAAAPPQQSQVCGAWKGTGSVSGVPDFEFNIVVTCPDNIGSYADSYSPSLKRHLRSDLTDVSLGAHTLRFTTENPGARFTIWLTLNQGMLEGDGTLTIKQNGRQMPISLAFSRPKS